MLESLSDQLLSELRVVEAQGRLRTLSTFSGPSRVQPIADGGDTLISFCSNDYLGLASHPAVISATAEASAASGSGAGSARLVAGTLPEHRALESALASLVRLPTALLFPSGYQANVGVLSALAGPQDLIVADRCVHASIIDGCRLSRAKLAFFPHGQPEKAQRHLAKHGPRARRRFLVTESLFSMDGDVASLQYLAALAKDHDAALFVDEAHALAALGPDGAGLSAASSVVPDILVGTLGKALGSSGAFVAGTALLRDYLLNRARAFIFTTALPPPVAAAALQAIRIACAQEGQTLRRRLADNVAAFRTQLALPQDPVLSPIIPLILGTEGAAIRASSRLRDLGFFVQAIRPPTVRAGTSRLRLTFSAAHTPDQVLRLTQALPAVLGDDARFGTSFPAPPLHPRPAHFQSTSSTFRFHRTLGRGLFIAGTDTGVGKTSVGLALLRLAARRGIRAVPFKPVETGALPLPRDAAALLAAADRPDLPLSVVCPIALPDPLAPAIAAARHGLDISLSNLLSHLHVAQSYGDFLITEAAGGILSPYSPTLTAADLAAGFQLPVLLVARNALGTINHTALAIAEIRRRQLPLLGVILVNLDDRENADKQSNVPLIASVSGISPLGPLPYLRNATPDELADALDASIPLAPLWARLSI